MENIHLPEQDQARRLSEYYEIIDKHKWTIVVTFIIIFSLTALYTYNITPIYRASAGLVLAYEQVKSPVTGETIVYENYMSQALNFNTHFNLITSRPVLEKVIKKLDLTQSSHNIFIEISPWKQILFRFKENIRLLLDIEEEVLTRLEQENRIVNMLRKKIRAERIPNTFLVKLIVEDHDPDMAALIANYLAESYIKFNIEYRTQSSKNTSSWMTDQLFEIRKQLESSEQEFLKYKGDEKIFSLEGKQEIITEKLSDFNTKLLQVRNERLQLDAKLSEMKRIFLKQGNITQVQSWIKNDMVQNLYSQLVSAEVELSRLMQIYKAKHPKLIQSKATISKIRKKLHDEIRKEIENMKAHRSVLVANEKVLAQTLDSFEDDALNTNKRELQYRILQRNVETNRKLYDVLLAKVKESDMVDNINASDSSSNIRIAERANTPGTPVKPDVRRNLLSGVIMGLLTGLALTFLLEYTDRTLRTEDDIRRYMGLTVLAIIPVADSAKEKIYGASSTSEKTDSAETKPAT
jgi:uncharacterized protein involved in exopolysaccharide biosynthesis